MIAICHLLALDKSNCCLEKLGKRSLLILAKSKYIIVLFGAKI
jgi:hypothetical protein